MKNIVVIAFAVLAIFGMVEWKDRQFEKNRQEITWAAPFRKNIIETVTLYGTVKEDGRETLYAAGNARIEEVYVAVGDVVKVGDPLVKLHPVVSDTNEIASYEDVTAWTNNLYQTVLVDETLVKQEIQTVFNRIIASEMQNETQNDGKAYTLYSPIDGMIISVSGRVGDTVTSIFPTVIVTDLNKLSIRTDATETALRQIKLGNKCSISVPALGDGSYMGEISHIDPYAHETGVLTGGGTYVTEVITTVNNHRGTLRPGYQATVKVDVGQQKNALLVPFDAITQDENGVEYVMIWTGKQAYRQDVVTGKEVDDYVQVVIGLTEKQNVIRNINQLNFTKGTVLYAAS